ncbi:MAG: molybdopterin-dependent oxidoreductase [candidate division Zixibacteria bacterium]|nr:molybdopterin-dependent oxidoreductase [candidate division Zixibacteria bacterium]
MRKRVLLFSILCLFLMAGCEEEAQVKGKREFEIKYYNGKRLSMIKDFRENSIKGPQFIDKDKYRLEITGLVINPKTYTYDEVINSHKSYKQLVELNSVDGWSVNILWEGVLVKDLLAEAQVLPRAKVVIFHSYEGYSTSFPVDYIMNNDIIMAYKMNNVNLPPERGFPFQLVAEGKWGYKWIKWITRIELSEDINYRGYWEQRGYSNNGNLNEDFFEK